MNASVTLHGPDYSPYVRVVRLVLEEKSVDYRLNQIDFLAEGFPDDHRSLHPFLRVPVLEHNGLRVFETSAIVRYLEDRFPSPILVPAEVEQRAFVNQTISIVDAYAKQAMIHDVFVQRVMSPIRSEVPDEARIQSGLKVAETVLATFDEMHQKKHVWLLSDEMTLADLYLIPMFLYFTQAPEGRSLLAGYPDLQRWWAHARELDSIANTRGPRG